MSDMFRLALPLALALPAAAQDPFVDPAPPRVANLSEIEPPAPRDHDGHVLVAAPKPLAEDAVTEDWPGFLGPRRDGRSRETRLLKEWPAGAPKLVWSVERGQGFAAPAVQGDHVVFAHRVRGEVFVDCLEAETGRMFWRLRYPATYRRGRYMADTGPRATPQIDGDKVFVHGAEGVLHCLELATGRVVWKRDLKAEFELSDGFFGVVSSPLIVSEQLIVNLGSPSPLICVAS